MPDHFPGCHPEDAEDLRPDKPADQIETTEDCWHCDTATARGACFCPDCTDGEIPQPSMYHCPVCRRWWAYMNLRVTKMEFGDDRG